MKLLAPAAGTRCASSLAQLAAAPAALCRCGQRRPAAAAAAAAVAVPGVGGPGRGAAGRHAQPRDDRRAAHGRLAGVADGGAAAAGRALPRLRRPPLRHPRLGHRLAARALHLDRHACCSSAAWRSCPSRCWCSPAKASSAWPGSATCAPGWPSCWSAPACRPRRPPAWRWPPTWRPRHSRPRVVALMYVMLLLGMVGGGTLCSALLADFSDKRWCRWCRARRC